MIRSDVHVSHTPAPSIGLLPSIGRGLFLCKLACSPRPTERYARTIRSNPPPFTQTSEAMSTAMDFEALMAEEMAAAFGSSTETCKQEAYKTSQLEERVRASPQAAAAMLSANLDPDFPTFDLQVSTVSYMALLRSIAATRHIEYHRRGPRQCITFQTFCLK